MLNDLDHKVQGRIMKALRLIWSQTFRAKAIQYNVVKTYSTNKDGSISKRCKIVGYTCDFCDHVFAKSDVQVDHPVPVKSGKTFVDKLNILFSPVEKYQVLCKPCHQVKTNKERKQ